MSEQEKAGQTGNGTDDGAQTNTNTNEGTQKQTNSNENNTGADKQFSQSELDAKIEKAKSEAKAEALKAAGIDFTDEKALNSYKEFLKSQKSEAELANEEKLENDRKVKEANDRALKAEVKAECLKAGAQPQFVDDLTELIAAKGIDSDKVTATVVEYKAKYAMWFEKEKGDEGDDKGKKKPTGTGASVGSRKRTNGKEGEGTEGKEEPESFGARLAANRRTTSQKKSFWGK